MTHPADDCFVRGINPDATTKALTQILDLPPRLRTYAQTMPGVTITLTPDTAMALAVILDHYPQLHRLNTNREQIQKTIDDMVAWSHNEGAKLKAEKDLSYRWGTVFGTVVAYSLYTLFDVLSRI